MTSLRQIKPSPDLELRLRVEDRPDHHALHMAMSRLRRALDVPGLITTIMKRGYRFNAERID
jgi:uroporphyrinogen-III synthase